MLHSMQYLIKKCLLLLSPCLLMACNVENSGSSPGSASAQRFDIDAYEAVEQSDDITGVWMMIQNGVRNQTLDNGSLFRVSGFIREIIEIKKVDEGGNTVYRQRNCLEPLNWRDITKTDDDLATVMGDRYMGSYNLRVSLSNDKRQMEGDARHNSEEISYSAVVNMKKIAADARSFGVFDFYTMNSESKTYIADCFQEAQLRTSVSSGSLYLSRSEIHIARMTDRQNEQQYRQAGYLITLAGSPKENYLEFVSHDEGADPFVDLYPQTDQSIYVNNIAAGIFSYNAHFGISQLFDGRILLSLD